MKTSPSGLLHIGPAFSCISACFCFWRKSADSTEGAAATIRDLIGSDVLRTAQALTKNNGRIDLSDFELVKERTQTYLAACAESGTIPNVLGLASFGFGCSRQWLNEYMRTHPDSQSAEYLEMVKDAFGNVLINAGLGRAADPTLSIFILKNANGFRDRFEIEPVTTPQSPLGPLADPEELRKRILGSVVIDDDD